MLIRHILLVGIAVATASCRPSLLVTTRVNQIAPKVLEVVVRCSEPDQFVVCIEDTGSPYGYSVFPTRLHAKDPSATIVFVSDTGSVASFIVTSGGRSTFFEVPTRSKDSSEKLWDSVSWSTSPVSIPADPGSRTVVLSVEWKNLATGATRELKAVVKKGEPGATDNPGDAQ